MSSENTAGLCRPLRFLTATVTTETPNNGDKLTNKCPQSSEKGKEARVRLTLLTHTRKRGVKTRQLPLRNPFAGFHNASPIFRQNDTKRNVCSAANFQRLLVPGCVSQPVRDRAIQPRQPPGLSTCAPHLLGGNALTGATHRSAPSGRTTVWCSLPHASRKPFAEAQEKQELKM